MIEISHETRSGWRLLVVRGRADTLAADDLESALKSAVEENGKVAADFSALDYISSGGLKAVLQAARAAEKRGSEFAICRLSAPVRRVFEMTGLNRALTIHPELPC